MNRNFERALSLVLKHEGGFVNHPADPGGATNKGVTIGTYRQYVNPKGTVADLKKITAAQVAKVYRDHYWNAVKADQLPDGLDYAVFDYAVNSGPSRAAKHLQAVLGVKQDGVIGPVTLVALTSLPASDLIKRLCDKRMTFLRGLKTWGTFGKGWTNRVNGVRSEALAMVSARTPIDPVQEQREMAERFQRGEIPLTPQNSTPAQSKPASSGTKAAAVGIAAALAAIAAWFSDLFEGLF